MATGVIGIRLALDGVQRAQRSLRDTTTDINRMGDAGARAARGFARIGDRALLSGAKGLGIGIAGIGVAAAGAAVGVGAMVKESLTSLQRIERINAQTENAIRSTGAAAGVTAQHIEDYTGALEGKTGTEAESIQMGANLLLTFTNIKNGVGAGNDIFDRATSAVTDMSRAMDTTGSATLDMTGTATMLGKALNDPIKGVTALRKVGVSFDEQQTKSIKKLTETGDVLGAQKIILGELQKEYGGSAEAFAKTTTGQIELAKHAYGTFGEAVSTALMPSIGMISGRMADMFNYLAVEVVPKTEGAFTALGAGITAASQRAADALTYIVGNADMMKMQLLGAMTGDFGAGAFAANLGAAFKIDPATAQQITPVLDSLFAKGRELATVFGSAFEALRSIPISPLNLLNQALGWAAANTETFKKVVIGVGAAYLVTKAAMLAYATYQAISAARTIAVTVATTAWSVATKAAAIAQKVFNTAMSANPIVKVITVISLLVAGLVWFFTKTELGQKIWSTVWGGIQAATSAVVGWFTGTALPAITGFFQGVADKAGAALGWVRSNWPLLLGIITGPIGFAVIQVVRHWDGIKEGARSAFDGVKGFIDGVIGKVQAFIDKLREVVNFIRDKLIGAISSIPGGTAVLGALGVKTNPPSANGGPVQGGLPGLVGERGPETFIPAQNGRILSREDSMKALSGSLVEPLSRLAAPAASSSQPIALDVYLDGQQLFTSWQRRASNKLARA